MIVLSILLGALGYLATLYNKRWVKIAGWIVCIAAIEVLGYLAIASDRHWLKVIGWVVSMAIAAVTVFVIGRAVGRGESGGTAPSPQGPPSPPPPAAPLTQISELDLGAGVVLQVPGANASVVVNINQVVEQSSKSESEQDGRDAG